MFKKSIYYFVMLLTACISVGFASSRYVVCGPDEDGCSKYEGLQYCACTPYNDQYGNKPYCLDFDNLTCAPLALKPDCDKELVFSNQAECLATIFQSEPEPPCKIKSESYCADNHMSFCDPNGNPQSCKQRANS